MALVNLAALLQKTLTKSTRLSPDKLFSNVKATHSLHAQFVPINEFEELADGHQCASMQSTSLHVSIPFSIPSLGG